MSDPEKQSKALLSKGDTERQAILRDRMTKRRCKTERSIFVPRIIPRLKPETRLLDTGCGTGDIIHEPAAKHRPERDQDHSALLHNECKKAVRCERYR